MNPKPQRTRPGDRSAARARRQIAEKYLEVADVIASEDGAAINVCVGCAILAGIAAGDAICMAAIGERSAGQSHTEAADLLGRVDQNLGKRLRALVALKAPAHYGENLLTASDRSNALRQATSLVEAARARTA